MSVFWRTLRTYLMNDPLAIFVLFKILFPENLFHIIRNLHIHVVDTQMVDNNCSEVA